MPGHIPGSLIGTEGARGGLTGGCSDPPQVKYPFSLCLLSELLHDCPQQGVKKGQPAAPEIRHQHEGHPAPVIALSRNIQPYGIPVSSVHRARSRHRYLFHLPVLWARTKRRETASSPSPKLPPVGSLVPTHLSNTRICTYKRHGAARIHWQPGNGTLAARRLKFEVPTEGQARGHRGITEHRLT